MSKKNLSLEEEASVLHYIEYGRGKQMKGLQRDVMYNIYSLFSSDGRTVNTCGCLDRDTHKKVDNWINTIEWSEYTKSTDKMKELLPDVYIEPIEMEEVSTQPIKIDLDKLSKAIEKRKAKAVPVKPVTKSKIKKK
tara:strand:+ start:32 stop:439 length:408 start_codon:yes stop_codon:yes gene_type:complete